MNIETLRTILDDPTVTDAQLSVYLDRAKKLAVNHYFWKETDTPTAVELERFFARYEYEIYAVAKAMNGSDARDGEIRHEELGIVRVWDKSGESNVTDALSAIPTRTYVV